MCTVCLVAAPRFETVENQPHDFNASVDDVVNIRCLTYANPPATVQWFYNGEPLDRKYQSSSRTLERSTIVGLLIIPSPVGDVEIQWIYM